MNNLFSQNKQSATLAISLIALVSVFVCIIVPIPGAMIDLLLVFSLSISVLIFMKAASINEWNELTSFPTILLLTALFRIVLNISTTRKILHDGQPGHVIEAAGNFVIGSNIGVGVVIFLILIVIQFIVANGSTRAAEVAARFTLDSLPGKQMSIDSDLQQRIITDQEAKDKRKKLDMEIDFYGNMDSAGKFIKGDVIAGVILAVVNIVAGLIIGMLVNGMTISEAAYKYTLLTIGDGIVNQICSLMIAVSAGILMTRVYNGEGQDVTKSIALELTNNPIVLYVAGGVFILLGVFTPMPALPFLLVAAALFYIAYSRKRAEKRKQQQEMDAKYKQDQLKMLQDSERIEVVTEVEPITLEVGIGLVPVVNTDKNGETLKDRINLMRKTIAKELGVKIPQIRVLDNASLMPFTKYNILVKDNGVATGELRVNQLLAVKGPYSLKEVDGQPTRDPVYGEEAVWITETKAKEASDFGYTVLDPLSILSAHLNEVIRKHLYEFIERQEVRNLLDSLKQRHQVLIEEIDKKEIDISVIQGVLRNLLRENISIKDLPTILEAIIDCKTQEKVPMNKIDDVTYIVRERISKHICERSKSVEGKIYVILPNNHIENGAQLLDRHDGYYLDLDPEDERRFIEGLVHEYQKAQASGIDPILLTKRAKTRFAVSRLVQKYGVPIPVVSMNELVPGTSMQHIGTIQN